MKEIWKEIPGYEGLYSISNFGSIISYVRTSGKILAQNRNTKGYLQVALWNYGEKKIFRVHRLVLLAFIGESKLECNHKDGDKLNNHLSNLEYCTPEENVKHKCDNGLCAVGEDLPITKLSKNEVRDIKLRLNEGESYWHIHKDYPVSANAVLAIRDGKSFSYVTI